MAGDDRQRLVGDWEVDEAGVLAETPIFALKRRTAVSPGGDKRGEFVYLDAPDWVNVVALTPDGRVVLIEQFRHGTCEVTLEIPGGAVDAGEEPVQAGLRELREETGFTGAEAQLIGTVTPNPAMQNNSCHTLLVRGAGRAGEASPDGLEEIAVRLVPLDEVADLIASGRIHHALVVAAFHHLELLRRS